MINWTLILASHTLGQWDTVYINLQVEKSLAQTLCFSHCTIYQSMVVGWWHLDSSVHRNCLHSRCLRHTASQMIYTIHQDIETDLNCILYCQKAVFNLMIYAIESQTL